MSVTNPKPKRWRRGPCKFVEPIPGHSDEVYRKDCRQVVCSACKEQVTSVFSGQCYKCHQADQELEPDQRHHRNPGWRWACLFGGTECEQCRGSFDENFIRTAPDDDLLYPTTLCGTCYMTLPPELRYFPKEWSEAIEEEWRYQDELFGDHDDRDFDDLPPIEELWDDRDFDDDLYACFY